MENIIGSVFGKWKVISFEGRDKKSEQLYLCQCHCGNQKIQRRSILKSNETTQCKSCYMQERNKVEELIGKRFGSWIVDNKIKNEKRNEWYYKCRCDCGFERLIAGHQLKSGRSTKCHICRCKTHGMSYTNTFKIWQGMLSRCNNPLLKAYKWYGARGIKVCERWFNFENFLEDMGERPEGLQIDRINNDGNYEPSNCRWVTAKVNSNNKRRCKKKETI